MPGSGSSRWARHVAAVFSLVFLFGVPAGSGQTAVLTYRNDNARTGQNTNETTLTIPVVSSNQFGKLWSQPVDGMVLAQPLYVPQLTIPALGTHNVVFAATEGDSVYAFDADSGGPLWKASLIDTAHGAATGATNVDVHDLLACQNILGKIGITGTPVISATFSGGTTSGGTMYVVAKSKENGVFVQRLHALDIATGNEILPGPKVISATVNGSGVGSQNGTISFDAQWQSNRPGLLFSNSTIYIGFASHCDYPTANPNPPPPPPPYYHGWVFAYDASSFTLQKAIVTTPNGIPMPNGTQDGGAGSIWMSGAALAADSSGNVFLATGNGDFDNMTDYGDSILKLQSGTLALVDFFTPWNQSWMWQCDYDLGSGGVLLLPDQPGNYPHLLVQAGKEGRIYLLNRDNMGRYQPPQPYSFSCSPPPPAGGPPNQNIDKAVQELPGALGELFGIPAYWNNTVYFGAANDVLKAFSLTNGRLGTNPVKSMDQYGFPDPNLSVSSNGTTNGILWVIKADTYYPTNGLTAPAVLRAYDAQTLTRIYSSDQNAIRDNPGWPAEYSVPTVVNGKVYVGTGPYSPNCVNNQGGGCTGSLSAFGSHASSSWISVYSLLR